MQGRQYRTWDEAAYAAKRSGEGQSSFGGFRKERY
jgi:hypothetical protein